MAYSLITMNNDKSVVLSARQTIAKLHPRACSVTSAWKGATPEVKNAVDKYQINVFTMCYKSLHPCLDKWMETHNKPLSKDML